MATNSMIETALDIFGANFGKSDSWKQAVFELWRASLDQYNDKRVYDAVLLTCQQNHKYTPKLGDVINNIKSKLSEDHIKEHTYAYCPDCVYHEGFVICYVQYYDKHGRWVVREGACRCTCNDAIKKAPNMATAQAFKEKYQNDQEIEFVGFLQTSRYKVHYGMEEYNPVKASEIRERARKRRELNNMRDAGNKFFKSLE